MRTSGQGRNTRGLARELGAVWRPRTGTLLRASWNKVPVLGWEPEERALVRWLPPRKWNRRALELFDDPIVDCAASSQRCVHLGHRVKHAVAVEVAVRQGGRVTGGELQEMNLPPAAVVPHVTR